MATVRVELRAKNADLYRLVTAGGASVAAFCRAHGFCQSRIGELLNLKRSPYRANGEPSADAVRLAALAGVLAEDLFPPMLYANLVTQPMVGEVSVDRFVSLSAARTLALPAAQDVTVAQGELREALTRALQTLTEKERYVIQRRFGLDVGGHEQGDRPSVEKVGAELGVSGQRAYQIERRALQKLRHPSRARHLIVHV